MSDFIPYIRGRLENNGYAVTAEKPNDLLLHTSDNKPVWICYVGQEITPEQIRRCLDFHGWVLFVVDEKLMPAEIVSRQDTPLWLRVIHGLWMGRIYVWNNKYLFGLHFDYDTGDISESAAIQPDELLLVETGTWLRGWAGTYRLARFWDKTWWTPEAAEGYSGKGDSGYQSAGYTDWKRQGSGRKAYEQARDEYQRQQQQRENRQERAYYAPPKQQGSKRDFMREFMTCGNLSAARKLYLQLVKDNHPDVHGQEKTAIMQDINAAWDKAQEVLI